AAHIYTLSLHDALPISHQPTKLKLPFLQCLPCKKFRFGRFNGSLLICLYLVNIKGVVNGKFSSLLPYCHKMFKPASAVFPAFFQHLLIIKQKFFLVLFQKVIVRAFICQKLNKNGGSFHGDKE